MNHLVQRHWGVDVYQVLFWLSMLAFFLVLVLPTVWIFVVIRTQSSEHKNYLSFHSLALRVWAHGLSSDSSELTEIFWTSDEWQILKRHHCIRCAVADICNWSIMGEITVGTKFRRSGGTVGGCIKDYQDVQLQFLTRITSTTLPSLAFLLAFCWLFP